VIYNFVSWKKSVTIKGLIDTRGVTRPNATPKNAEWPSS